MSRHESRRVMHEVRMRRLAVRRVERLTPHMQRIVLGGAELEGFFSGAPDDHVKLFFPNDAGELVFPKRGPNGLEYPPGADPSPMRDYTPRHHDTLHGELTVDFVLHGDGPASTWADAAKVGDVIGAGGPRGSFVVADDFDHYVLVADETGLPAIGRWLEEMPASASATVLVEVPDESDRQVLFTDAQCDVRWFERDGVDAAVSTLLEDALRGVSPKGDAFYWIAAESRRARNMRLMLAERGVPKEWVRATGYWKADGTDDEDE
ncbi:siderophore-interacting protein [Dyella sp. SG609]|uniref:siderophore-interacting protein n=1 Tax=Dyella sp. SG609 TaxID=2587018 RepID=UPI001444AA74|nr:siderophore-interacting protein [Dyella sp. SG609]